MKTKSQSHCRAQALEPPFPVSVCLFLAVAAIDVAATVFSLLVA